MSGKGKPVNPQSRLNPPLPRGQLAVGTIAKFNGGYWAPSVDLTGGGETTGAVTISLDMPKEYAVAGSPASSGGTFIVTWLAESGNAFFASPANGSSGDPEFRAMVSDDLPEPIVLGGVTGTFYVYNLGTATYWSYTPDAITGILTPTDTGSASPP